MKRNNNNNNKKQNKDESKSEVKFIDSLNPTLITSSTGTIVFLNPCGQGLSYTSRIGNDISVRSLEVKLYLYQIFTGTITQSLTRIIFFVDLQQRDSLSPVVTDLIFPSAPTALRNYPNRRRFKFLADIPIPLDVYKPHKVMNFTLPVNLVSRYSSSLPNDINKNGIYMLVISDGGLVSASVLDYSIRCKFTDD